MHEAERRAKLKAQMENEACCATGAPPSQYGAYAGDTCRGEEPARPETRYETAVRALRERIFRADVERAECTKALDTLIRHPEAIEFIDLLRSGLVVLLLMLFAAGTAMASSVNLSWNEGTTTVPFAFNLYREALPAGQTTCDSFVKPATGVTTPWSLLVGSIAGAQTTQSDSTIKAGVTYCYAVTAYATDGSQPETAPSNLFLIAIPAPSAPTLPPPTSLTGSFVQ